MDKPLSLTQFTILVDKLTNLVKIYGGDNIKRVLDTMNKTESINLIYIGEDFYRSSGTVMSSLYNEGGERYDWNLVKSTIKEGKEVRIRNATESELLAAHKRLTQILEERAESDERNGERELKREGR